jgi:hypothetical protein
MAKRKAAQESISLDEAFESSLEQVYKVNGQDVATGGSEQLMCISLPMPALAPRFLFQQDGLPLERFILLDGRQESGKSALGYEMIRWNRLCGGKGKIIEVEEKQSPELCLSINRYDHKAYSTAYCETMQDWHKSLTFWIQHFAKLLGGDPSAPKSRPGVGKIAPVLFLVDSIMAAVGESTMDEIEKVGHGQRRFASDTGLLSEYMKAFTKWLRSYPFTVVGINHLKPTQDSRGFQVRNMPGGKAPGYHASIDIEVLKKGEGQRARDRFMDLTLRLQKNSVGSKGEINVEMTWFIDYDNPLDDGQCLQHTRFEWEAASIGLLLDCVDKLGADRSKRLQELVGIRQVGPKAAKKVACDALGITEEDALSWREAGTVLEDKLKSDKEFRDRLYPVLGILRRRLFVPGVCYDKQLAAARADAAGLCRKQSEAASRVEAAVRVALPTEDVRQRFDAIDVESRATADPFEVTDEVTRELTL